MNNKSSKTVIRKTFLRFQEVINKKAKSARRTLAGIPLLQRVYFIYNFDFKRKLLGFLFTNRYSYNEYFFQDSFLTDNSINNQYTYHKKAPEKIFCFWTGENEMSPSRQNAFNDLIHNAGINVVLIKPNNLEPYIKKDYPLHPGYQYLSLVHKSDYLRCYFMHHYGGGYSDIKRTTSSWEEPFRQILEKPDKWIVGYREFGLGGVASVEGKVGIQLRKNWYVLLGNCAYICKPYSPFTSEWYLELHNRMDCFMKELQANPGNILGDNPGYPISWTQILGQIFHPLCLKYHNRLVYNEKLRPIIKGHR